MHAKNGCGWRGFGHVRHFPGQRRAWRPGACPYAAPPIEGLGRMTDMGRNGADAVVAALVAAGTERLFGVPGGGSSLDLIAAARAAGLPFTLARQETAAMI